MPRERLRTSRRASAVEAYGWNRVPPSAGPRAVECTAMIALSPVAGSFAKTTCSCSEPCSKTSTARDADMDGPAFCVGHGVVWRGDGGARRDGACSTSHGSARLRSQENDVAVCPVPRDPAADRRPVEGDEQPGV